MALVLRENDVRQLLSMDSVIAAVEDSMRQLGHGRAENQPRRRIRPPDGMLNVMFASYPAAGFYGLKSYSIGPGGARFLVVLYGSSGELTALIEANLLGAFRTGAATAVAVRALARKQPLQVGLIGTGHQARTQALALSRAVEVAQLRIFGRDEERRRRFRDAVAEETGLDVQAASSAEAAVRDADVVVTITSSGTPVLSDEWLRDDALVVGAGCNHPHRNELPPEVFRDAFVVVDQLETAKMESGDLLAAERAGTFAWDQATGLSQVLTEGTDGQDSRRTVFESQGLAIWDVAAAATIMERIKDDPTGEELELLA